MILAIDPRVFKARAELNCRVLLQDIGRNLETSNTNLRIAVDGAAVSSAFWKISQDFDRTDARPEDTIAFDLLDKLVNPNELVQEEVPSVLSTDLQVFLDSSQCTLLPVEPEILSMAYELQHRSQDYRVIVVCDYTCDEQVSIRCLCDYGFRQSVSHLIKDFEKDRVFKISEHQPLSGLFPQTVDHKLYSNYFEIAMEKYLRRKTDYFCDSQLPFDCGSLRGDIDVMGSVIKDGVLHLHIVECKFKELVGGNQRGISAKAVNQAVKCLIYAFQSKAWERIEDFKKQPTSQAFSDVKISGAVVTTLGSFCEDEDLVINTVRNECQALYSQLGDSFPKEFDIYFEHASINPTYTTKHQVNILNKTKWGAWRFTISRDKNKNAIWNIEKHGSPCSSSTSPTL